MLRNTVGWGVLFRLFMKMYGPTLLAEAWYKFSTHDYGPTVDSMVFFFIKATVSVANMEC